MSMDRLQVIQIKLSCDWAALKLAKTQKRDVGFCLREVSLVLQAEQVSKNV